MSQVIIIGRVSHTDSSQDPEGQIIELREYCRSLGHKILAEYSSQESVKTGRISYTPIIDLLDKHPDTDYLVFTEVCRISRKLLDLLRFVDQMHSRRVGILIKTINVPTLFNDKTPNHLTMMCLQMFGMMAEQINQLHGRRIKTGRRLGSQSVKRRVYCSHLSKEQCVEAYNLYKDGWLDSIKTIKSTCTSLSEKYKTSRATMAKFLSAAGRARGVEKYFKIVEDFNARQEMLAKKKTEAKTGKSK